VTGIYYSLFVAIYGIAGLILYYIFGGMASEAFTGGDYALIVFGGLFETTGMIFTIYAASIGVGGIAFALANTCCIYVTLFNYLCMGQEITAA
jgi:hypothetical protein